jgi:hypothetical protein
MQSMNCLEIGIFASQMQQIGVSNEALSSALPKQNSQSHTILKYRPVVPVVLCVVVVPGLPLPAQSD